MALPHAHLLDVIHVAPLGAALEHAVSTSLLKSEQLQLLHMVLSQHHRQPEHAVDKECTVHCLEGRVDVEMPGGTRALGPGDVVVMPAGQRHALHARTDCALLVTLLLDHGDAGGHGRHGPASHLGPAQVLPRTGST